MKKTIQPFTTNRTLNPVLWEDFKLKPLVRFKLLEIAKDFIDTLKVPDLNLQDITISGSNAGYNYSQYSDIDLHLVVDVDDEELEDYYNAKKTLYNSKYSITVKNIPVEVYVQKATQPHYSSGIYSILDDVWIRKPSKKFTKIDTDKVMQKAKDYATSIKHALHSSNLELVTNTLDDISRLRKAGLEKNGENSVENLAFKLLRSEGLIEKLRKYSYKLKTDELSLKERMKIYELLRETEPEKVAKIDGDKATLSTGRVVDAKALAPDPAHPGQFTIPPTDPSTITPGATVTTTATESSEEEEEENDLISPHGNKHIGGYPDEDFLDGDHDDGKGGVIDKKWEKGARGEGGYGNNNVGIRSPVGSNDRLSADDALMKMLTIAGLR